MRCLAGFSLGQGGSVLVEISEPLMASAMRGLGKDDSALVKEAATTSEDATVAVVPAGRSLIIRPRSIDDPPDDVGYRVRLAINCAGWSISCCRWRNEIHGAYYLTTLGSGNLNGRLCRNS